MSKKIYIFLFDGYSDWEISYVTPEISKHPDFELIYFSKDGNLVSSMGGLQVKPNISLAEINTDEVDMLILPGGTAWEKDENNEINQLVNDLYTKKVTIASICAATTYLGKMGFLNNLKHTSNDLYYLKGTVPQYSGESSYINSLAVSDENIITANGVAPIEFASEIFKKLNLYTGNDLEKWFQLFKNGIWSE